MTRVRVSSISLHEQSLVLGLLVTKFDPRAREFPQLVADHLICDFDREVVFAVVYHESEADERGNNGAAASLCPDRSVFFQGFRERSGE